MIPRGPVFIAKWKRLTRTLIGLKEELTMKSEKLKMGEKVAYGLGDLGNGLMFQFAQLFLLKFYTDVLQIPAYWGGLIF